MTEPKRFALSPQLDIAQILLEATSRWLRANEVCEVLRNYQKFQLTSDPPQKPPGGSLFLYDRKILRYFRKDGYQWRKKKDGKTVREAHERLKSGSVDVIHCYYAHREDNENFQRRCYWLLDEQLEHIVLVHYREVDAGNTPGITHLSNTGMVMQHTAQGAQSNIGGQMSYSSSPSNVNWSAPTLSTELEDVDSGDDIGVSSFAESMSGSGHQIYSASPSVAANIDFPGCGTFVSHPFNMGSIVGSEVNRLLDPIPSNQLISRSAVRTEGPQQETYRTVQRPGILELPVENASGRSFGRAHVAEVASAPSLPQVLTGNRKNIEKNISFNQSSHFGMLNRAIRDPSVKTSDLVTYGGSSLQEYHKEENRVCHQVRIDNVDDVNPSYQLPLEDQFHMDSEFKNSNPSYVNVSSFQSPYLEVENSQGSKCVGQSDEQVGLKRLDSFGRWMNREIGRDCDDSLMASDSCNYWNALDTVTDNKEISGLSRHMQLDTDSLCPSLSREQLFSIIDFSPDWGYSDTETKILISGNFLGGTKSDSVKWCCMFGEVEVQVEVLTTSTLRCKAPVHAPGRVPFYITCGNRVACSEVREFEYREHPSGSGSLSAPGNVPKDEIDLKICFAKILSQGIDSQELVCDVDNCPNCSIKKILYPMLNDSETDWDILQKNNEALSNSGDSIDLLIEKLLKRRLYEWLVSKSHEEGKGPNILDRQGRGVIHMAAALGYEWAISPIVAAGVSPNFRDVHGRTGLHWAAYFGREETVVELLRLGAAPGAVEDPTSKRPTGQTAADLASSRGHKGIAGYLAEADLTSHLSALTVKETVIDSVSANLAAEKAVETVEKKSFSQDMVVREKSSLKCSLAAVRKSAQAAARIQAAFRMHSFHQRLSMMNTSYISEMSNEAMAVSSMSRCQKIGHFTDYLHSAAVKIQKKYRGWKGRKEFLKIRNRIVKIQAHVRGHQVRKHYKKVVWSVGIVEKVILRWRRKGTGLRGFRAGRGQVTDQSEVGKTDEYDFLHLARKEKAAGVDKALARVQSMARHPEARDQYMRLVASSQKSESGGEDRTNVQDTEIHKASMID